MQVLHQDIIRDTNTFQNLTRIPIDNMPGYYHLQAIYTFFQCFVLILLVTCFLEDQFVGKESMI